MQCSPLAFSLFSSSSTGSGTTLGTQGNMRSGIVLSFVNVAERSASQRSKARWVLDCAGFVLVLRAGQGKLLVEPRVREGFAAVFGAVFVVLFSVSATVLFAKLAKRNRCKRVAQPSL
jgi:hypothetical protein